MYPRRVKTAGFALLALLGSLRFQAGAQAQPPRVTFNKDIAPLVFERCASCHQPGGLGPGITISGTLQSAPGGGSTQNGGDTSLNNNYNISAATFRTLTGQTLTQTSVIVRLLEPGTTYLPRLNYGDIRVAKRVQLGRYRLQGQFDIFNATNANPVTGITQTFGTSYGKVSDIMPLRVFAVGGTLSF